MPGELNDGIGGEGLVDRRRISHALRRVIDDHPDAFAILDPATQDRWTAQASGEWPDQAPPDQTPVEQ